MKWQWTWWTSCCWSRKRRSNSESHDHTTLCRPSEPSRSPPSSSETSPGFTEHWSSFTKASSLFHYSLIALSTPLCDQHVLLLSQSGHWRLIHITLHHGSLLLSQSGHWRHGPHSTINSINITTIQRPTSNVGHRVLCMHRWLCPIRSFELGPMQQLMFSKVV